MALKAYTYTAQQLGLKELPPGKLRLGGFDSTRNHNEADVFIVPCDIRHLSEQAIAELPYLKGNEARHAFYCISDRPTRTLGLPAITFRADCNAALKSVEPSTIPWPWPVNPTRDIDRFAHEPRQGFKYDVCFVGWNSTPLTREAVDSCQNLTGYFALANQFYGTWETEQRTQLLKEKRFEFLDSMHNSRLSLCARSIAVGVVRYRFYEALAMGRIPVHINDGECLPFQNKIDWDKCRLKIPEHEVGKTGAILREWLDHHTDKEILERGNYGKEMWQTWLDGSKWDELFGFCASERLAGHL